MAQSKGTPPPHHARGWGGGKRQATPELIMDLIKDEHHKHRDEMREEVRRMQESNEKAITTFKEELKEMDARLQASQIEQLDQAVSDHNDRVGDMEAEVEHLGDLCKTLKARLDEQEDFSRRQNLRVVGFPEGAEGANATKFISRMLEGLVADGVLDKAPEVDRTHRSR